MAAPRHQGNLRRIFEWSWRALIAAAAIVILVLVALRWTLWEGRPGWKYTDDAYLTADVTPIISRVPGYIDTIPVRDYQRVRAGQLIAQIVDIDYKATVDRDIANIAQAEAQAEVLQAQYRLQEANLHAAHAVETSTSADLAQNGRDIARQLRLLATGSSTVEAKEKINTTGAELTAKLAQDRAQVAAAGRQLKVLAAQYDQAVATVAAQKAQLRFDQLNLFYTRITAPQDGVLAQRQIKPGQWVPAGGQITSLTPLDVWVIANYRETQLHHMRVGQKARITIDTFPDRVVRGHVQSLSPGSGAVFALLPPDNATGNFTKVVQRWPVKIVIDDWNGLEGRVIPGLSVEARVDARDERR
jgi:membrane fusion protein (multidrug efflux system)